MKRRGITLIEIMVALAISVFVIGASALAYRSGMTANLKIEEARSADLARTQFEDQIRNYLQAAYVGTNATDRLSYLIGDTDSGSNTSLTSGNNANRLTFTAIGMRLPGYALSSETDFEQLNRDIGPQGGATEVSFSMTAVGSAPNGATGLFLRTQTPADGDATQGGKERLFSADVTDIGFEFYDGANWDGTWNTNSGTRRLPAAIRVTYHLKDDNNPYYLIVRLPNSDVTSANPVSQGATG